MAPRKNGLATSSSDLLRTKLDTTRKSLLTAGLYLGDQNFKIDQVIWRRISGDNCLVTKESADAVDAAHAVIAAMETTPGEDSESTPTPEYDIAVLSAVVHISDDDFWMSSCRNWKGTSQYCPKFSDLKLTCTGKSPSQMPFSKDFPTVLTNLTALANLAAKFTEKKGLFIERPPDRKIRFRHVLFEVSIISPSVVKADFVNITLNRNCLMQKRIHLHWKPHQKTTVCISTFLIIVYTV